VGIRAKWWALEPSGASEPSGSQWSSLDASNTTALLIASVAGVEW